MLTCEPLGADRLAALCQLCVLSPFVEPFAGNILSSVSGSMGSRGSRKLPRRARSSAPAIPWTWRDPTPPQVKHLASSFRCTKDQSGLDDGVRSATAPGSARPRLRVRGPSNKLFRCKAAVQHLGRCKLPGFTTKIGLLSGCKLETAKNGLRTSDTSDARTRRGIQCSSRGWGKPFCVKRGGEAPLSVTAPLIRAVFSRNTRRAAS